MKKAYFLIVLFLCGLSVGNVCASASAAAAAAPDLGQELRVAAMRGYKAEVEELIAAGADVNDQDSLGWTALMDAASQGYDDIVEKLLDAGADRTIQNRIGETAEDIARATDKEDLANYIRDYRSGRHIKFAGKNK